MLTPVEIASLANSIAEAKSLIDHADQRAIEVDGPVSHARDEMTDAEWTRLYECICAAERVTAPLLEAARARFAAHAAKREPHQVRPHIPGDASSPPVGLLPKS